MTSFIQLATTILGIAALGSVLIPLIAMQHTMEKRGRTYTFVDAPVTVPRDYWKYAREAQSGMLLFWWYVSGWVFGIIGVPVLIIAGL